MKQYKLPRGICRVCGSTFAVSRAGNVRRHYGWAPSVNSLCPGSGQPQLILPQGTS